MTPKPRVLAFAGSLRRASWNKKLARVGAAAARAAGAEVTELDLADLPLPLYDQDLEDAHGLPENARELKRLMKSHDAFLISAPEYNSSISGVLKNAIDWASRKEGDEPPLACFRGKTALLLAASPGALGGLRGLVHVRAILGNLGVLVLPRQKAVSRAHEAIDEAGALTDPKLAAEVEELAAELVHVTAKLLA